MKHLIIRDNHGNHIGFNVKWSLLGEYHSLKEAQNNLDRWAVEEKCIDEMTSNERGIFSYIDNDWDEISEEKQQELLDGANPYLDYEYLFGKETHFEHDGKHWHIISEDDFETFFNGHTTGYKPGFIKEIQSQEIREDLELRWDCVKDLIEQYLDINHHEVKTDLVEDAINSIEKELDL